MVHSCTLVGGCRDWFLMCAPYCTLGRPRFGLRMLLALSAYCIFPSWLHASLPRNYNWLFSLMSTSCLSLRPPAAMTDGWFLPVQAVSSAGLCNTFLEHHDHTFLLGACWRRLLWACVRLPSSWRGQPSAAAPEAGWTLCWGGWLSWGLLCSTCGLAIWCQGWSASSVGETTPVTWSAQIENQGLCTLQEDGNDDDGPVYLDLCGEAARVTLPISLCLVLFHRLSDQLQFNLSSRKLLLTQIIWKTSGLFPTSLLCQKSQRRLFYSSC